MSHPEIASGKQAITPYMFLSTAEHPLHDRYAWLHEIIGREYASVSITPPKDGSLFNEMTIFPWGDLQLSVIRSSALAIERLPRTPPVNSQDAYFAVILLSGEYSLQQNGREVFLKPGDMALYDATRPHKVYCPSAFNKLIVSIPRGLLKRRMAGVEHMTAMRVPGDAAMGAIASRFVQATAESARVLATNDFRDTSYYAMDLLMRAFASLSTTGYQLSHSRAAALCGIKDYIEQQLANPELNALLIAQGTGYSVRYISKLFQGEGDSLMRYVWRRRAEQCRRDFLQCKPAQRISDIAFRWGFNDIAHFSRFFKQQFGLAPRDFLKTRQ